MTNEPQSTDDLTVDRIKAIVSEATGAMAKVLDTGGGCQVLAWANHRGQVCWLSDDDAGLPTSIEGGLVLGIYEGDDREPLWPSEDGCEGERFYFGTWANAEGLAALLVEARDDVRAPADIRPAWMGEPVRLAWVVR